MTQIDKEIISHMTNPHNYGRLENADSIGIGENPLNGEKVILYINVSKDKDNFIISDISFEAIACMTTVVAGSIITNEAKNISFSMAEELIAVTLGMLENVPPEEAACSEMVALALKAAMDGYKMSLEDGEKKSLIYKINQSCSPDKEHNLKDNR